MLIFYGLLLVLAIYSYRVSHSGKNLPAAILGV